MTTQNQEPVQMSHEDLLYSAMNGMNKEQLELLRRDIDDEIELKKFKDKRVKQIKLDIEKETQKLLMQAKLKLNRNKNLQVEESDDDDNIELEIEEPEEVKPKPVNKKRRLQGRRK